MSEPFQVPATISKIVTMHDDSLRLSVDAQILRDSKEEQMLLGLRNRLGWFMFKDEEITRNDLENMPDEYVKKPGKSPSQRLRSVIWVYCQQKGIKDADGFYENAIEDYIAEWKDQLEDLPFKEDE